MIKKKIFMQDKKGEALLRSIFIILAIFGIVIGLISIFVESMADEYGDATMKAEYFRTSVNNSGANVSSNMYSDMGENIADLGEMNLITGGAFVAKKVISIVKKVVFAPTYFAGAVSTLLGAVGVPDTFVIMINVFIQTILYTLIIFIVITAALGGSKV